MKKVLLTGATGRIGANLIPLLLQRGYQVRSYVMSDDPKRSKLASLDTEMITGDLRDAGALQRAVQGIDGVLHLGWVMNRPAGMSRAAYWDVNVNGTHNLLEALAGVADRVERIVFATTNATYSAFNPQYLPMDEAHPQNPFFEYGLSKVVGERMMRNYGLEYGIPVTMLRLGTVVACDEVLNLWTLGYATAILRGFGMHPASGLYAPRVEQPWRPLEQAGAPESLAIVRHLDGRPWRHHAVDLRDILDAFVVGLEHPAAADEVFNILGPTSVTCEAAVKTIAARTGQPYVEVALPNLWDWACDIRKAERQLGWRPQHDIGSMVDLALRFQAGEEVGLVPA